MANQSVAEQFDELYGRIWAAFLKASAEDLSQHERQLLHHIPSDQGIPLGEVARHLGIPKSSASEQVKSLERRGFLTRRRDPDDERRLAIVLTAEGLAQVRSDSVLDLGRLGAALKRLRASDRKALVDGLDRLVGAASDNRSAVRGRVEDVAGYSGRSGAEKMGIRAGSVVVLLEPPVAWRPQGAPPGVSYQGVREIPGAAVVVLFARSQAALSNGVNRAAVGLGAESSLWVAWPRRAGGHTSDVTEQLIRDVALPLGLVDVKVAALDHDWSGLKLVWRLGNRHNKLHRAADNG
jgi:DNA-binding MarR family transcriptional regulator